MKRPTKDGKKPPGFAQTFGESNRRTTGWCCCTEKLIQTVSLHVIGEEEGSSYFVVVCGGLASRKGHSVVAVGRRTISLHQTLCD